MQGVIVAFLLGKYQGGELSDIISMFSADD